MPALLTVIAFRLNTQAAIKACRAEAAALDAKKQNMKITKSTDMPRAKLVVARGVFFFCVYVCVVSYRVFGTMRSVVILMTRLACRYSLSLYTHVSSIKWDYEDDSQVKGYIVSTNAADTR